MDYFDLGLYSMPVTTDSDEAQMWFGRGVNWTNAYDHDEAVACFEKTVEFKAVAACCACAQAAMAATA